TTLAKLLCRLYDPQSGAIEVDGADLRDLDLESWRRQVAAVFQDFVRFELTLRENVAPRQTGGAVGAAADGAAALDDTVNAALAEAGAGPLAGPDTVLAQGYSRGTDPSAGPRRTVALRPGWTGWWRRVTPAAPTCPAGSGSASPWRGRCRRYGWAPGWCCSTNRPPSSTSGAKRRSSSGSSRRRDPARRSSSRTGSPPSGTSTGSRSGRTAP